MDTDPHGMSVLDLSDCWTLVRSAEVGRLAVVVDNQPEIFPINFLVDHGSVVFRTAEGTKLAAALTCESVAFEVDGYDPDRGDAWSVVLKGPATEIKRPLELLDATDLPLFPWYAAPKQRFVRITPRDVSGRQFHVVADPSAGTSGAVRHAPPE
jgi:nitroimidazol reductase NimA-like FMN-containing flavoprotein (pyridoxamine 5'-phosphate oxidase superfamily)